MSKRVCPKCESKNTSAVVNGYDGLTVLAGCGCRDCGAVWEAYDTRYQRGEPFNVKDSGPLRPDDEVQS